MGAKKKLRITRNREADELSVHNQGDPVMMEALKSAVQKLWSRVSLHFGTSGRADRNPSDLIVLATADLIGELVQEKVQLMSEYADMRGAAVDLQSLSQKASAYAVADDILKRLIKDYRPLAMSDQFEIIHEARSPLIELNELLTAYIAVSDDIFSWSFRRVIPIPGIFQPINWHGHQEALSAIADGIDANTAAIAALLNKPCNSAAVHGAVTACVSYCQALHDAVSGLKAICSRMEGKASGLHAYGLQQYREDLANYRAAEQQYYKLGDAMNVAFSVLRPFFN